MKKMLKCSLFVMLLGLLLFPPGNAQASVKKNRILSVYPVKQSCSADLDGDGIKEKLKLELTRDQYGSYITKARFYVNGTKALSYNKLKDATYVGVDYAKMTNSKIFLRILVSGDNDIVYEDAFYRYDTARHKLVKAAGLLDINGWGASAEIKSVSKSQIKLAYRYQFYEIGSVKWTSTYVYQKGKLHLASNISNVKSVYTTEYDPDGYGKLFQQNKFKAMSSFSLYKTSSLDNMSYIAKQGDTLTLKKIKYTGKSYYVQYAKGSKIGWIKLDTEFGNHATLFYGVQNRLAG